MSTETAGATGAGNRTREGFPQLALVALMFIGSGASGLMYEVLWTRSLTTWFGASLYAVATVLASFMGGLALGSLLLGRRADRMKRPLFVYGALEVGIALSALAFPFLLELGGKVIGAFYVTGGEGTFYVFSLIRFVITFLLLLLPTTMMGATLPVLSRALARDEGVVGRAVGGLYALNTVGACLGVFLAGFFLIERFGLSGTKVIAVAVNVGVGLLAMAVGRTRFVIEDAAPEAAGPESEPAPTDEASVPRRFLLASYLFSGMAALGLQVCWTRAMIFSFDTLKNTTYSFSGMLLVFLVGLALGSAIMHALVDRQKHLLRLYGLLQMGVGTAAAMSFFLIQSYDPGIEDLTPDDVLVWHLAIARVLLKTAVSIGLPTLLMGMAFPVIARLMVRSTAEVGGDTGKLYAANTFGAILGSAGAGFVFIPVLGIANTIALLSGVYVLIGASALWMDGRRDGTARMLAVAGAVVGVLLSARVMTAAKAMPFQRLLPGESLAYYDEGPLATVSVIEDGAGERMIHVDNVGVAGTDQILQTDQKTLAHVPMALLGGEATRVLSVGFGAGGASWSYSRYPGIDEIHAIEISPEVLRAAPTLTEANHGIVLPADMVEDARSKGATQVQGAAYPLSAYTHTAAPGFLTFDPRYRVLIDDARSYLRFTELQYDVIATDCTDLRYKSNANLYDLEYFTLCRERITDRGLVVVWMPLAGLSDRAFRIALRTFAEVFPHMSVWYYANYPTHYVLLIAGKEPGRIDYAQVQKAVSQEATREDLGLIGLLDPDKLISCFVTDDRKTGPYLGEGPLNTEDIPVLEFESPREGYGRGPIAYNMGKLFDIQVPAATLLANAPAGAAERITTLQEANRVAFQGHVAYRAYDFVEACRLYLEAQKLAPEDQALKDLLDFYELRARVDRAKEAELDGNNVWLTHSLGAVYVMQGRYSDAVSAVEPIATRLPAPAQGLAKEVSDAGVALNTLLAKAYLLAGREDRARRFLDEARRYSTTVESFDEFRTKALAKAP